MTKIWLINCINDNRKRAVETSYTSLGNSYIASYVQKYGGFCDITITDTGQNFGCELLDKIKPDIVGISTVTQNYDIAQEIGRKVKTKLNIPIIVGGHHITALPNNLGCADIGVLGEGEQTFLEILQEYEASGLDEKRLDKIDGIVYRYNNELKITRGRKQIRPLDRIPFPARDLLHLSSNNLYMFTSRGCPYNCVFCSSSAFWQGTRFFSAEYVVNEIKELLDKYNAKYINLYDDLFIADKKRLEKIAELIKKEKIDERITFACLARANLVDEEIASLLKSMNVKHVSMGLESGSERVLKYLKGGTVTVKQNEQAVNILKKYHFEVDASFIIGSPGETIEDCVQTLKFLKRTKIDNGETYVLLPFPGTKVWEDAKQKGLLNDHMKWAAFEIYMEDNAERILVADKLEKEELLYAIKLFKTEWANRARKQFLRHAIRHPTQLPVFIVKKIKKVA